MLSLLTESDAIVKFGRFLAFIHYLHNFYAWSVTPRTVLAELLFPEKVRSLVFIDPELTRLWPLKVDELTRPGMIARLVDTGSGYIKPEISWQ